MEVSEQDLEQIYGNAIDKLRALVQVKKIDTRAFVELVCRHNWVERQIVGKLYNKKYGKSVTIEAILQTRFPREYRLLSRYLFQERYQAWASYIKQLLEDKLTKPERVATALLLRSDTDMAAIRKKISDAEIQDRITNYFKTRADLQGLQKLCQESTTNTQRHDFNQDEVIQYFKQARNERDPKRQRKAVNMLIKLLTQCSTKTYAAIVDGLGGLRELETIIKQVSTQKSEQYALTLLSAYLYDPRIGISRALKQSMKGLGTDDALLILLTTLYSDYLRGKIDEIYRNENYGASLFTDIRNDTSGEYRQLLLAMWGFEVDK